MTHKALKWLSHTAGFTLTAVFLASASIAQAAELRWSSPTDPQTMDPHAVNTAPVLGFLNNVYEGLVRRGKSMEIEGALAESWEPIGSEGWRFNLRKGVKFHDGADFTAEDVLFSYQRASSDEADTSSWFAPVKSVEIVDDYTIDFRTHAPNPIFPDSIANFMILDKGWAEANNTVRPSKETETYATLNANGTGPFTVTSREPGVQTVLEPFDGWWDETEHNLTKATFLPISNPATAVSGLLSGQVDLINPVPVQDVDRIAGDKDLTLHQDIEARVIMLGFGHAHDALKYSKETSDKNPFQDVRVRKAAQMAINAEGLVDKIMRGNAEVASQLVSPQMKGYSSAASDRLGYDPEGAKALLAEAGYADGFSFGLKCPNDRYINDEALCKAMAAMLTQAGMRADLNAMPVRSYWPELRAGNFDMYLLGWSPGTFDAEHPIRFLVTTPNKEKKLGSWNFGGYSDARVDELLPKIQKEIDPDARQTMLDEIALKVRDDVVYIPLHIQPLLWGSKSNISLTQRADNFLMLRWITVN